MSDELRKAAEAYKNGAAQRAPQAVKAATATATANAKAAAQGGRS